MRRRLAWILLVAASSSASCNQIFGLSETKLDDGAVTGDSPGSACANVQCGSDVCDPADGRCHPCVGSAVLGCPDTAPICTADDTCRRCASSSDCASLVCEDNGACAEGSAVAYVSGTRGADGQPCTLDDPCLTISRALQAAHIVKVLATLEGPTTLTATGASGYEIVGDSGVGLSAGSASGNQATLTIGNGITVELRDLLITGGSPGILVTAPTAPAVVTIVHCTITANQALGISVAAAANGSTFTMSRSVIEGNAGGGAALEGGNAAFQIVGNAFVGNGSATSAVGGLFIDASATVASATAFNTIANNVSISSNQSTSSNANGLRCSGAVANAYDIVAFNGTSAPLGGGTTPCTYSHTMLFSDGSNQAAAPAGSGNVVANPGFHAGSDIHLATGSPAIGAGGSDAPIGDLSAVDIDGVSRVEPADLGAFVYVP